MVDSNHHSNHDGQVTGCSPVEKNRIPPSGDWWYLNDYDHEVFICMGLHFVLCSMEKSEKHSHSECIGLHFVLWSTVIFICFQFLRRCFKDANFSAIIQNSMEKPVGFFSTEPRATLTSGLANIRHPSTTLYCKNTGSSWMIMHEFILYSAIVFI